MNIGPFRKVANFSRAHLLASGVRWVRSSAVMVWRDKGGGRRGRGWVGQAVSPGAVAGGTGTSSIGNREWPVTRSKT